MGIRKLSKWEVKEITLTKEIKAEFEHEALIKIGEEILQGRFKLVIGKIKIKSEDIKEIQERRY